MSIFHGRGYRCSPFRPDMIWDPFRDFPAGPPIPPAFVNAWNFRNWETPEAHFFQADLQGLIGDEIKVETEEGNVLRISGEKKVDKEERSDAWQRMEHSSGRFLRRYKLPDNANLDKTKASMENGALTVIVPKTETYTNPPSMRPIHIN